MTILNAVLLSLFAGLATGVGGALVLLFDNLDMRTYDALIGFAAGVMTAIATLGLIQEALELNGIWVTLAGVATGAIVLFLFDRYLPHEHEHLPFECVNPLAYRRGVLLFAALTLHNVPEGLAVGTSYSAQPRMGMLLALAMALHNIPEGIAVAGPFLACGMPRWRCLLWTVGSGIAEPIAAFVGALFVSLFSAFLPFSLAFAGGAMLYVVSDELIPESHSHGYEHQATFGFISGFVLFMVLVRLIE
jgi:ZIP family zinc transporter